MKFSKLIKKVLKYTGIVTGSILLIMFLLPVLFPGFVSQKIKEWTNGSIKGELNFSRVRLSFFNHFPSLTLTLYDASLKGSAPFQKDTLVAGKEIALGVNLGSLFGKSFTIDEIYLTDGKINILAGADGRPNYNVYVSDGTQKKSTDTSSSASIKLSRIQIDNCTLVYDDESIPFFVKVGRFDYLGKGDLSKSVFDLASHIKMEGAYLSYDKQPYLENKRLSANLVTKINTSSFSLLFEENNLKINRLPVEFKGRFDFLKNGYDMDFQLKTGKTDFKNLFSALPPAFVNWVEKKTVKGDMVMNASLRGKYLAKENIAPSLLFNIKVDDGYINSKNAKEPAHDFTLDFHFKLPQLNTDSMQVDLDSVHIAIGEKFLQGAAHTNGLSKAFVDGHLKGEVDIEKLNRVLGDPDSLELKGLYQFNTVFKGLYSKGQNTAKLRPDTIITSIPSFSLQSSLKDGYMKYYNLPQAVKDISFNLDAFCNDNKYEHTNIKLDNINAIALNNFFKGFVHISGLDNFPIDADIKTKFNLADIKSFYPIKDVDLKGDMDITIAAKGNYNSTERKFPVTNAYINLKNGFIKTPYYPEPVSDIQVEAIITATSESLKDVQVNLKPVSLMFAGNPFILTGDLKDFDNISYKVASKGTLDIGKLYKVFAIKGYDVNGLVRTDFVLSGTQADAVAGRYGKLSNKGTLEMQDIYLVSDLFPKLFLIKSGSFHFNNDQLVADDLKINYGSSNALLKGYFTNIINYYLQPAEVLKGELTLSSDYLNVDELMAYGGKVDSAAAKNDTVAAGGGVILVPANLDLKIAANAGKVNYNGLNIEKCKAELGIKEGGFVLNNTGFTIIGAPVNINATYKSKSTQRADFSCHIDAKEFDIKKAYNEIPLFRAMATSASSAEGIVSLDYNLSGVLDANMYPLLPSLKGGGVLSVKKVKIKGLKLFSAVSKATNRDSLDNPDLSKVDIKSKIANNIMTIERTKMKIFGFRPRFEGQVGLDGKLNLKGRIGLPPFGIFGIPFSVRGTQDVPVVKLRKGKKGDELEEKEYNDEDLKESQHNAPKGNEEKKEIKQ